MLQVLTDMLGSLLKLLLGHAVGVGGCVQATAGTAAGQCSNCWQTCLGPCRSCCWVMLQVLAAVHRPLMELLVEEAFQAILEVSAADSSDVRAHELKGAMPPVEVGGGSAMLLVVTIVHTSVRYIQPGQPDTIFTPL